MKTLKRKNILLASMLLGTVALSTVGFSAWVITQGAEDYAEGTITVDKVEDKSHTISTPEFSTDALNDAEIKFGVAAASENLDITHTPWVGVGTDGVQEDLVAVVTFTVGNADADYFTDANDEDEKFGKLDVTLEATTAEGKSGTYASALAKNYVGALPSVSNGQITISTAQNASNTSDMDVTLTITFKWGTFFKATYVTTEDNPETDNVNEKVTTPKEGVNPIDHYNMLDGTSANATALKTVLGDGTDANKGELATLLDGVGYKLTVKTNA